MLVTAIAAFAALCLCVLSAIGILSSANLNIMAMSGQVPGGHFTRAADVVTHAVVGFWSLIWLICLIPQ